MWNNLKSDLYRVFHSKSFYVVLLGLLVVYGVMLLDAGMQSRTIFAAFHPDKNTFIEYLYYLPKSGIFVAFVLLYIGIFASDEYISGFAKNTHAICTHKWKLVLSRFMSVVLIISFYLIVIVLEALIIQLIQPIAQGSFVILDILLFYLIQIGMIACVGSFIMMNVHFIRGRVLAVMIALVYGMMMWYMFLGMISNLIFGNVDILAYTIYELSGKLPITFSWESYQTAILVLIGNTLLYNVISYYTLKKKDL